MNRRRRGLNVGDGGRYGNGNGDGNGDGKLTLVELNR